MKTPHTEEDPMNRASNIDAGAKAFFPFIIKWKKGVWIMNDNNINKTAEKTNITDTPDNFKERLNRLSPFQRPLLPASYYPFACKDKPKKNHTQRRNTGNRITGGRLKDLPIVCHLVGVGADAGRLNQW